MPPRSLRFLPAEQLVTKMSGIVNRQITGSWHCGPGNEIKDYDPYDPQDEACWRHDKGYQRILDKGGNPYTKYNEYDEGFIQDPNVMPVWKLPFIAKKAAMKHSWLDEYKEIGSKRKRDEPSKLRKMRAVAKKQPGFKKTMPYNRRRRRTRYNRRRKFRRPLRKGRRRRRKKRLPKKLYYKRLAARLAKEMLPHRICKGQSFFNMTFAANLAHYIAAGPFGHGYAPYSYDRYLKMAGAIAGSVISTDIDDQFAFRWPYSSTRYILHNPNNFPIKVTYYTYKKVKTNSLNDTLLSEFGAALDTTDTHKVIAQLAVASGHADTADTEANGCFERLSIPHVYNLMDMAFSQRDFRIKRKGTTIMAPGTYRQMWLKQSKKRKVHGQEFDIEDHHPWMIFPMWRVECPHMNTDVTTTQADILKAGTPPFDVTFRIETKDIGQEYPDGDTVTEIFYQDNTVMDCLIDPAGAAGEFTVASKVGAANADADNE